MTLRYLIFGVATTAVNWLTYTLLQQTTTLPLALNNAVAWAVAVLFAFITNKLWVFTSPSWEKELVWREGVTFLASRLASGVIEIVGVPLLYSLGVDQSLFGVEGLVAKG
ncbi:MAG: GtrA family protein, partial [Symbiobacteriaceae bacterium]|nr:GtrA family protein [Symbiobacteriaceae bacterium]